jgi:hypothetical protein
MAEERSETQPQPPAPNPQPRRAKRSPEPASTFSGSRARCLNHRIRVIIELNPFFYPGGRGERRIPWVPSAQEFQEATA